MAGKSHLIKSLLNVRYNRRSFFPNAKFKIKTGKREAKQRRSSNQDYQVISLGPIKLTESERIALWDENIEGLSDLNLRNIALAGGIAAFILLVSLSGKEENSSVKQYMT